ncbi:MAG: transporter, iron chelate uptake transporter (FeCT) family, permease protein [Bacillota bacterium]|nr:transporter, iron chelate uptake transporter (FeCT) family, permease protein [Bacillota bacterium]
MTKKLKLLVLLSATSLILIVLFILIGVDVNNYGYFLSKRIPKVLAIIITGVSIAFSSTIFQTVTNNRILTPSVLGLDSLYLLVQTIVIFTLGSSSQFVGDKNINFIVSVSLMLVFSGILFKFLFNKEKNNIMTILLVGMIFGTLFQSLSSFMQMVIDPNEFLHVQDKMFASFNNINTKILTLSSIIIMLIILYTFKYYSILDVISLGKEHSINLGVNHNKVVKIMLFLISVLVSISTALVGPITFLGLLAVNLSREMLKTYEHKILFVSSSLISVISLVGGQLFVERVLNFGTPISVIINFIGGIYFVYLLLKENIA